MNISLGQKRKHAAPKIQAPKPKTEEPNKKRIKFDLS